MTDWRFFHVEGAVGVEIRRERASGAAEARPASLLDRGA
jgi:hypothetical protein